MAAGYTIYQGAASNKWCVVELPDEWTRDDVLPPKSFTDRWFDTLDDGPPFRSSTLPASFSLVHFPHSRRAPSGCRLALLFGNVRDQGFGRQQQ